MALAVTDILSLPSRPFDPELAAALIAGLKQSPAVNAAETEAKAAEVNISAARWQQAPTVSVQGNYYQVQSGQPKRLAPTVTVDLPLWDNGRTRAGINRARGNSQVSKANLKGEQIYAALQISGQFFDYKRLSERIKVVNRNLASLEAMQQSMQRRADQEVSPQSDLELARTRTLQVQMMRDALLAQRQAVLRRMREQLNEPAYQLSERSIHSDFALKGELEDFISAAEANDPQRERLAAEARVASADAAALRASRFPSLGAQYSYDEVFQHRLGITVKAQATGLSEFVSARAAGLRENAAELKVETAVHDLRMQVSNDYIDYTSAISRLDVARSVSVSTDAVRDSYVRQFTAGRRTWLDVMNAVREAMSAQLDAVDIEFSAAAAQARLLIRVGVMPVDENRQN